MLVLICLHLHSCGAYREILFLQSVPTSPDSSPPQTMVNTQQTSTTVATASVWMVLYEHVEDSQELFLFIIY